MIASQVKDKMLGSVARSLEAEGANYDRVLKRMQNRLKSAEKKSKKS